MNAKTIKKMGLLVLIIFSLLIRVMLISQEITILIEKFLPDDPFYYHAIARNIVDGKGIVFNEGIRTNGFHPLFLLFILPFHYIFPNNLNAPIYCSLILTSCFSVFTSIYIFRIFQKLFDENYALIASSLWLFSPSIIFISLIGIEGTCQVFFIAMITNKLVQL